MTRNGKICEGGRQTKDWRALRHMIFTRIRNGRVCERVTWGLSGTEILQESVEMGRFEKMRARLMSGGLSDTGSISPGSRMERSARE